jgi:hypothetical protein
MSKGKALVVAMVTAVAVIGWRFIESVLSEAPDGPGPADTPAGASEAPAAGARAGKPAGGGPSAPAGATKAELYEIATKLDIEGRSKMNKAELAKAIEQAS